MCGTADWEWEQDRYAYEPQIQVCHGCYVKDSLREDATSPGSTIILVPKEKAALNRARPKRAPRRVRAE